MDDVDVTGVAESFRGAVEGDEDAFAAVWRAFHPLVVRYLRVVVGDACDDVASETWLQVARDLPGYRGDVNGFRVWLFRIARNRAIDEQRRIGRRAEDPVADITSAAGPAWEASPLDTAREAIDQMATRRAVALIAELPRDQAEAVMLRTVAGFDAAQAAEVLGKRPGAVRIAAMRGLRKLGRRLGEEREPRELLGHERLGPARANTGKV